jgi:hypothetical protein
MDRALPPWAPPKGLDTFRRCIKEVRNGIPRDVRLGLAMRATIALAGQLRPRAEVPNLLRREVLARLSNLYHHDKDDPSEVEQWRAFSRRCIARRGDWDQLKYLSWLLVGPTDQVRDYCEGFDIPECCERA